VEYVVKPDGHIAIQNGSEMEIDVCLGLCMISLLLAAMLSMPLWLALSNCIGKYPTWIGYNMLNAFTNILFVCAGEGDSWLCIFLTFLNGIPVGGQFLIDSILADTIGYDEFLNGCRSEGSFTVFGTLIPKFVAIPAAAIPLATINMLGFVPPVESVAQPQPDEVTWFIRATFVFFPFVCTTIGMFAKLGFPIRTREMNEQIAEGIALHHEGKPAHDPVTGQTCELLKLTPEEEQEIWHFENFSEKWLQLLLLPEEEGGGPMPLVAHLRKWLLIGAGLTVLSIAATCLTFQLLTNAKLAILPILFVISSGMLICFTLVNCLRYKSAVGLKNHIRADERNAKEAMVYELIRVLIEQKKKGQRTGKPAVSWFMQFFCCKTKKDSTSLSSTESWETFGEEGKASGVEYSPMNSPTAVHMEMPDIPAYPPQDKADCSNDGITPPQERDGVGGDGQECAPNK